MGKVIQLQGDWQSSQQIGNYVIRLVRTSHLGLDSHELIQKKIALRCSRKQNLEYKAIVSNFQILQVQEI